MRTDPRLCFTTNMPENPPILRDEPPPPTAAQGVESDTSSPIAVEKGDDTSQRQPAPKPIRIVFKKSLDAGPTALASLPSSSTETDKSRLELDGAAHDTPTLSTVASTASETSDGHVEQITTKDHINASDVIKDETDTSSVTDELEVVTNTSMTMDADKEGKTEEEEVEEMDTSSQVASSGHTPTNPHDSVSFGGEAAAAVVAVEEDGQFVPYRCWPLAIDLSKRVRKIVRAIEVQRNKEAREKQRKEKLQEREREREEKRIERLKLQAERKEARRARALKGPKLEWSKMEKNSLVRGLLALGLPLVEKKSIETAADEADDCSKAVTEDSAMDISEDQTKESKSGDSNSSNETLAMTKSERVVDVKDVKMEDADNDGVQNKKRDTATKDTKQEGKKEDTKENEAKEGQREEIKASTKDHKEEGSNDGHERVEEGTKDGDKEERPEEMKKGPAKDVREETERGNSKQDRQDEKRDHSEQQEENKDSVIDDNADEAEEEEEEVEDDEDEPEVDWDRLYEIVKLNRKPVELMADYALVLLEKAKEAVDEHERRKEAEEWDVEDVQQGGKRKQKKKEIEQAEEQKKTTGRNRDSAVVEEVLSLRQCQRLMQRIRWFEKLRNLIKNPKLEIGLNRGKQTLWRSRRPITHFPVALLLVVDFISYHLYSSA